MEKPRNMNSRLSSILPWLLLALIVILAAVAVFFLLVNQVGAGRESDASLYSDILYLFSAVVGAAVGALIVARRHRHPIGWLLLGVAFVQVGVDVCTGYSAYSLITQPGALLGALFFAWLAQWVWTLVFAALVLILLLYPTGHLLSRRWRIVVAAGFVGEAALLLSLALASELYVGNGNPPLTLRNPIGLIDAEKIVQPILLPLFFAFILVTVFAALVSLIIRFRRAHGDERQQLKWFTYAAALAVVTEPVAGVLLGEWSGVVQNLAFLMLPLAIGVAILKYRLYDIDLLINRTLVYVPLTALLAGIFSASITLSQKIFVAITGTTSDAATVMTTLIVVAAFDPLKNNLQHVVDRRFKEVPDARKELQNIREQAQAVVQVIDVEQSTRRVLEASVRAFDAVGGALYLTSAGQMRLVHSLGEWKGDARLTVPLASDGKVLGEIALGARRSGAEYSDRDRAVLQETVAPVARAIELSEGMNLGHESGNK